MTKNLSGAARATIDACRTLFIWLFALRMGWEQFHMLQVRPGQPSLLLAEDTRGRPTVTATTCPEIAVA